MYCCLLIACYLVSTAQCQFAQASTITPSVSDDRPVYVFYTANVVLGSSFAPRTVTIISKPMLFDGQESTQLAGKSRFEQQVKAILPQLMANDGQVRTDLASVISGKIVRADNSDELNRRAEAIVRNLPVSIHYNYLVNNIKKTARSEQECYQAIQYHKEFVLKALAEINESTEFFQL